MNTELENLENVDLEWLVEIFLELYVEGKITAVEAWFFIKDL